MMTIMSIIYTVPTTKLRTPPSFYVFSYGATCLIATRITFERLGIDFFFFFWRPEEKSIYKSYTLDIFVGLTPKSLHPRLPIKNTLLPCHKRRVKTGFLKNRLKILGNMIAEPGLHTKID
jgi:hypothetical protein